MSEFKSKLYTEHIKYSETEMLKRSQEFYNKIKTRRSIRNFSNQTFPIEIIKYCVLAAGTAPSGANKQPWKFIIVHEKEIKRKIRIAAEEEEIAFYSHKAPKEWLEDLKPIGTTAEKPFLEIAPYIIVIFEIKYDETENSTKSKNYYVKESVGIATGFLINALHNAGIATLTHTPSPMNFLNKILNRPPNEKPYMIIVAGFPSKKAEVPEIKKKSFDEIASII